jgi:orotate phosphoribosyltransferase
MLNYKEELADKGHFLIDGKHTDSYLDPVKVVSDPKLFEPIIKKLILIDGTERLYAKEFDTIIGTPGIGSYLAAPIALRTDKIFVYPEKVHNIQLLPIKGWKCEGYDEPKRRPELISKMQLRRGYDKIVAGKKVLLITDVIETGKSVMDTIGCIHKAGGKVVEVRCIWNRGCEDELQYTWNPGSVFKELFSRIPILSIIDEVVESWEPEECPLCEENAISRNMSIEPRNPLTDPKTGEVI